MRPMFALVLLGACARHDPPAPDASPSVAVFSAPAPAPAPAMPSAPAPAIASDPATLPQTRDRPRASGAAFDARVSALWSAIVSGNPDRAMPLFFPLGAYQQVKDIADPAADWKARLVAAYARDIKALHRRLGDDASRAAFVSLDVPDARATWVDPGGEYNKIGYFRVFGSKIRYRVGDEERSFEVKSLISWRGEWYVVHLSAIK